METKFNYKKNMKKGSLMFVLMPTIAFLTDFSFDEKCYSINIVWLFFDLEFNFEKKVKLVDYEK